MSEWFECRKKPIVLQALLVTEPASVGDGMSRTMVEPGDFLLKTEEGHVYPCKASIFEKYYERPKRHEENNTADKCPECGKQGKQIEERKVDVR